jgi:hypothetical protein
MRQQLRKVSVKDGEFFVYNDTHNFRVSLETLRRFMRLNRAINAKQLCDLVHNDIAPVGYSFADGNVHNFHPDNVLPRYVDEGRPYFDIADGGFGTVEFMGKTYIMDLDVLVRVFNRGSDWVAGAGTGFPRLKVGGVRKCLRTAVNEVTGRATAASSVPYSAGAFDFRRKPELEGSFGTGSSTGASRFGAQPTSSAATPSAFGAKPQATQAGRVPLSVLPAVGAPLRDIQENAARGMLNARITPASVAVSSGDRPLSLTTGWTASIGDEMFTAGKVGLKTGEAFFAEKAVHLPLDMAYVFVQAEFVPVTVAILSGETPELSHLRALYETVVRRMEVTDAQGRAYSEFQGRALEGVFEQQLHAARAQLAFFSEPSAEAEEFAVHCFEGTLKCMIEGAGIKSERFESMSCDEQRAMYIANRLAAFVAERVDAFSAGIAAASLYADVFGENARAQIDVLEAGEVDVNDELVRKGDAAEQRKLWKCVMAEFIRKACSPFVAERYSAREVADRFAEIAANAERSYGKSIADIRAALVSADAASPATPSMTGATTASAATGFAKRSTPFSRKPATSSFTKPILRKPTFSTARFAKNVRFSSPLNPAASAKSNPFRGASRFGKK